MVVVEGEAAVAEGGRRTDLPFAVNGFVAVRVLF